MNSRIHKNDEDWLYWSCELDGDNDNLSFSQELQKAYVPNHFVLPKILLYEERGDHEKHLNTHKARISMRGTSLVLKCRAFHLTLYKQQKKWYSNSILVASRLG